MAWLLFISAIEVAANHHDISIALPREKLQESIPELAELLQREGDNSLLDAAAERIAPRLGALKKFIGFVMFFLDSHRDPISPSYCRIDWAEHSIKPILKKVYDYRSRALHDGTPFPAPMCWAPHYFYVEKVHCETVLGLAASSKGSVWLKKDMPINLYGFHKIVRNVLVRWWESLPKSTPT